MRPQEGLLKAAVHPPCKEDSALNISVIVKLVTTGRTANSFVTTNERSLFGRMQPVHGTWTHAINQPHVDLCHIRPGLMHLREHKKLYTVNTFVIQGKSTYKEQKYGVASLLVR